MSPTEKQLLQWKAQYAVIGSVRIEDETVYYRSLTPSELLAFEELEKAMPKKSWVEAINSVAVLYPESRNFMKAGSDFVLQEAIMDSSVPMDEQGNFKLEEYRSWAEHIVKNNAAFVLAAAISRVYPSTDLISLLDMPMEKLMRMATLVEKITGQELFSGGKSDSNDPAELLRKQLELDKKKLR